MEKNKTLINIYAKRYIQEVFESRLQEEGFICPDDKLLCWYRMKNAEVINSVIFCSSWSSLPLFLDIGYEISPLFTRPMYIRNVHFNASTHHRLDCFRRTAILEKGSISAANLSPYSSDIQVCAPKHDGRGIYTFEEVLLPKFNSVMTINECYLAHKKFHLSIEPRYKDKMFTDVSREYIDEALYVDDIEVYPYCKARILRALEMYRKLVERKPNQKELQEILQHWEQLKVAFFDDGRKEYLGILEQRKSENIHYLKTKLGILV